MSGEPSSFLSRWSRRKADVRRGVDVDVGLEATPLDRVTLGGGAAPESARLPPLDVSPPAVADTREVPASVPRTGSLAPEAEPPPALPTFEDVARLTRESDYAPFVQPGVDAGVKNAALRKLFSDPHFNVMDGLDTYIEDYGKADPIPPAMLRHLNQALSLGLFDESSSAARGDPRQRAAPASDASTTLDVAAHDAQARGEETPQDPPPPTDTANDPPA